MDYSSLKPIRVNRDGFGKLMVRLRDQEKVIMSKKTTNIYKDQIFVRSEKYTTLREYLEMGRELEPGSLICLAEDIDEKRHSSYETFYVGDCTPYHQPSEDDGGFGWDYDHPRMSKYIVEIHLPISKSSPKFE